MSKEKLQEATIRDFGDQWLHYQESPGFYGSTQFLQDVLGPLLDLREIAGCRSLDIGSGTGRIVSMLLQAGAAHVTALEPSEAVQVLRRQAADWGNRVSVIHGTVAALPASLQVDMVFCIGVLHHIPDPLPVLRAALSALRPGGRLFLWVYGREGNGLYLFLFGLLHFLLKPSPDWLLRRICRSLAAAVRVYGRLCRRWPLPLASYINDVFTKVDKEQQELIVFDQINPAYAKYYRREEILRLVETVGFQDLEAVHRHGYSWTVTARRNGGRP